MNTRQLNEREASNLAALNTVGIESALLFITATGLAKSILDATHPIRKLLSTACIHDFLHQGKGIENKVMLEAVILTDSAVKLTQLSLYRPLTKDGDPRMWFYGLKDLAQADHVYAVFTIRSRVHIMNLSVVHFGVANLPSETLTNFFAPLYKSASFIAEELLEKLYKLSRAGPIRGVCKGDTAIGRSIEDALNIPQNSSKKPDYKGIEIKSARSRVGTRETRATLFACVPDWHLSNFKSSGEILQKFGYMRGEQLKLYCSVSTKGANSQGLLLRVDAKNRDLIEEAACGSVSQVALWKLEHLERRLGEKHKETFWIKAKSEMSSGIEWFHLESVIHTKNPNIPQFEQLLSSGAITLDHLIKQTPTGQVEEKGPLFKIKRGRIPELFLGQPTSHSFV